MLRISLYKSSFIEPSFGLSGFNYKKNPFHDSRYIIKYFFTDLFTIAMRWYLTLSADSNEIYISNCPLYFR